MLDNYKNKLDEARKIWNKEDISKLELEFVNLLLKEVYKYERTVEKWKDWKTSFPSDMIKTNDTVCLWKTFISESFLEYVWIKHYNLEIPSHSAFSIIFSNGEEYYFDPTNFDELTKLNYEKDKKFKIKKREEPERGLINWVLLNNNSTGFLKIGLSINPNDFSLLINLWDRLIDTWKYLFNN